MRSDEWTKREDEFLVQTILEYVRYGKTQLEAFEDIGDKLDRSAAACGFRWNKELRKNYTEELRIARRKRRGQSIDVPKIEKPPVKQAVHHNKPFIIELDVDFEARKRPEFACKDFEEFTKLVKFFVSRGHQLRFREEK